jgi:hypothetical protein
MSGIFVSPRIRCGLAMMEPQHTEADRTNTSATVPGSRLLSPYRTAILQSGSPPGDTDLPPCKAAFTHPALETIFLYAAPVSLDVFRREIRGCGDAKAKCA